MGGRGEEEEEKENGEGGGRGGEKTKRREKSEIYLGRPGGMNQKAFRNASYNTRQG